MRCDLLDRLIACPRCHGRLAATSRGYSCGACGRDFAREGQIPVLLTPEAEAALAVLKDAWGGDKVTTAANQRLVAILRRLVPPSAPFLNLVSRANLSRIGAWLGARGSEAVLLDLGSGGGAGAGMAALDPRLLAERTVFLDVASSPGVNLIGDGAALPLKDQSFDAVLLKAVLEHVPDPQGVIAEARRVLKPGGLLYLEVPFLFEYHPNPGDYTRYTRAGLEGLLGGFESVEVGTLVGPATALASLLAHTVALGFSLGRIGPRKALHRFLTWLTWPLSLADLVLVRLPGSHAVAHHLWARAAKPGR